ncbi:unnamed protein product [Agarophyton chilense]
MGEFISGSLIFYFAYHVGYAFISHRYRNQGTRRECALLALEMCSASLYSIWLNTCINGLYSGVDCEAICC